MECKMTIVEGAGFGGKIKISVLDTLSLRYLLDVQESIPTWQLVISVWKGPNGDINVLNIVKYWIYFTLVLCELLTHQVNVCYSNASLNRTEN